jgi:hypothetical protein
MELGERMDPDALQHCEPELVVVERCIVVRR